MPIYRGGTGIAPTKERHRQNGGLVSETIPSDTSYGSSVKRYRAVWECPLDVYRDKKIINGSEYKAGLRFHRAYYGAVICRRPEFHPVGRNEAALESTMSDELLKAVYKMLPSEDLEAVIDVCGHSQPAWNPRALEKLRKGLGHLAIQWNMAAIEVCEHKPKPG